MKNNIKTLANGLKVVVDELDYVETVCLAVVVNTGSQNENKANNGISHFLEHMAFKGTKTRTAKQIAQDFEDIGGKINAYTSWENTVFHVKVLKKDVKFAIEFLSDIIQNSIFDEKEIERERGVILQEISMYNDNPSSIIFDHFHEAAFPNQPIGRPILGPVSNVKKFTRDDILNYVNDKYKIKNMAVVASGNIKESDFIKYVEDSFTELEDGLVEEAPTGKYVGGYFVEERDIEQTSIVLGFKGITTVDSNYTTSELLSYILGGGMSSRLFQEVREKRGLCYTIQAFNYSGSKSGCFGIYSAINPKDLDELLSTVSQEVKSLMKGISDTELNRAKSQLCSSLLISSESNSKRLGKICNDIFSYGYIKSYEDTNKEILSVNRNDILELSETIFNTDTTLALIGKDLKGKELSVNIK